MCGGHADEPVASYREGDVVRVRSPEHAIFEERIGRVGACDAAFAIARTRSATVGSLKAPAPKATAKCLAPSITDRN